MLSILTLLIVSLTITVSTSSEAVDEVKHRPYIVGGWPAPPNKYTYLAALRRLAPSGIWRHVCSGAIIAGSWIVTAAHCLNFPNNDPTTSKIVAGTTDYGAGGETYYVNNWVLYDHYESHPFDDIGLIRIEGTFHFSDTITQIALENINSNFAGKIADFAGWGLDKFKGKTPAKLQEIQLQLISQDVCRRYFDVGPGHLCTYNEPGQGTCFGDSGGPLVLDGYLIGVASYIKPCAAGVPDVFTRIAAYVDWILSTIQYVDTNFPSSR